MEHTISTSTQRLLSLQEFSLHDVEALRLLLCGGSVIDWQRLSFTDQEQVGRFLSSNEFHIDRPRDRERIRYLQQAATTYLAEDLEYQVPRSLMELHDSTDLFLLASGAKSVTQRLACSILKVMHIIHHIEGRELLFNLPISNSDLFYLIEDKVARSIGEMIGQGLPIVDFSGGRKKKNSIITKLLSKKETIAAQVYDKIRFKIVAKSEKDILPLLQHLADRFFPFNYAIPRESKNTLFDFQKTINEDSRLSRYVEQLQVGVGIPAAEKNHKTDALNPFSAQDYKVINFIVDLPLKIDGLLEKLHYQDKDNLGDIVFGLVEFQIVDEKTAIENERGQNSHQLYKARQVEQVHRRLMEGRPYFSDE